MITTIKTSKIIVFCLKFPKFYSKTPLLVISIITSFLSVQLPLYHITSPLNSDKFRFLGYFQYSIYSPYYPFLCYSQSFAS